MLPLFGTPALPWMMMSYNPWTHMQLLSQPIPQEEITKVMEQYLEMCNAAMKFMYKI
jgi:hypothetical protein